MRDEKDRIMVSGEEEEAAGTLQDETWKLEVFYMSVRRPIMTAAQ